MEDMEHDRTLRTPLLTAKDLWLFWTGIALLGLAVIVVFWLLLVFLGPYHADFLTYQGALEAAGATLGTIATTLAAIGSALLFIVSLRVQARELQHSIQELRNSVKAQNDAANNHKQALELSQEQLQIAKQEKEFNVCKAAIDDLDEDWNWLLYGSDPDESGSIKHWARIAEQWSTVYKKSIFYGDHGKYWHFQRDKFDRDRLPPFKINIEETVERLAWLVAAIQVKEIDWRDRRYLVTLLKVVQIDVDDRVNGIISDAIEEIEKLVQVEAPEEKRRIDPNRLLAIRDEHLIPMRETLVRTERELRLLERTLTQQ